MAFLTELSPSGVALANRDETYPGKSLTVIPLTLTSMGLWGSSVTAVPDSAFGVSVADLFPLYLYLDSVSVIHR